MPFGIGEGLQLAAGLGGIFGKRRPSPSARLALESSRKSNALADRLETIASGFDPELEAEKSIRFAEKSAGRSLGIANAEINRRFLSAGGNPSGDTAFIGLRRRADDDILNPVAEFSANARAAAVQKKFDLFMAALNARGAATGSLAGTAGLAGGNGGANTASLGLLADLFDRLDQSGPLAKRNLNTLDSIGRKKRINAGTN